MTAALEPAFNFSDLQGLAGLRREALSDSPEGRRAVAQQFEALFLNMMLKQMRDAAVVEGGVLERERLRFHEDMMDSQLALSLARGRGIGLADAILRQFGGEGQVRPVSAAGGIGLSRRPDIRSAPPSRPQAREETVAMASPADFVRSLWPHARRAARALGVAPDVLVAQAALETGWGRHMIRDQEGRPSFNLFGIKAGESWNGPRATVRTLEFVDGLPRTSREPFRVYDSLTESFADYVALVRGSPRYRAALTAAGAEGYVRGLQSGGYATDPEYADKILAILARGLPGVPDQARAATTDNYVKESGRAPGPTRRDGT